MHKTRLVSGIFFVLLLMSYTDVQSSESCPHWQKDVAPPLLQSTYSAVTLKACTAAQGRCYRFVDYSQIFLSVRLSAG